MQPHSAEYVNHVLSQLSNLRVHAHPFPLADELVDTPDGNIPMINVVIKFFSNCQAP